MEKIYGGNGKVLWDPACAFCAERDPNGFHPTHDASQMCQSGGYTHCTCNACF